MKEKAITHLSIIVGAISGPIAKIFTSNYFAIICVAVLSGAASYVGGQLAKYIHKKIRKHF